MKRFCCCLTLVLSLACGGCDELRNSDGAGSSRSAVPQDVVLSAKETVELTSPQLERELGYGLALPPKAVTGRLTKPSEPETHRVSHSFSEPGFSLHITARPEEPRLSQITQHDLDRLASTGLAEQFISTCKPIEFAKVRFDGRDCLMLHYSYYSSSGLRGRPRRMVVCQYSFNHRKNNLTFQFSVAEKDYDQALPVMQSILSSVVLED